MRCNPGHSHRHIHHHHHHHSHCDTIYGGSVFAVSHHCGGNSGGFWGGFGAGLGMGLGNMLGGFMNSFTSGFGNMFGGFGNMFGGFGMGGFGFGMPMMGGFGMGGFGMPWAASYGGGTVKDDAYFASKYGTGKSSSTSSSSSVKSGEEEVKDGENDNVSGNTGGTRNTEKVTINGKDVDINNIKLDKLKNMTDEDLKVIDDAKAKKILEQIGFLDDKGVGKMSTEYVVLRLLEISGVNVQCANNSNAADKWIKGKITNVKKDEKTNKLSYDIDCKGVTDASFKYLYHFEQQDDGSGGRQIFKVTDVYKNRSSQNGYLIEDNNQYRDYYYDNDKNYLIKVKQGENECLISNNNDNKNRTEVKEKDANSAGN